MDDRRRRHGRDAGQTVPLSSRPVLDAFRAECAALRSALDELAAGDWSRPTNCPPWDLHELVVHIAFSIQMPARIPAPVDPVASGSAADYYRRPVRDTPPYRTGNVEKAQATAKTIARGGAPGLFAEVADRAHATFEAHDPAQPMEGGGLILTIEDYLITRLVSVAAHGVDVAMSVGRPVWTTSEATGAMRGMFLDLLGGPAPAMWTDQHLLELGTGRRPLTSNDRDVLGPLAARFPLLS